MTNTTLKTTIAAAALGGLIAATSALPAQARLPDVVEHNTPQQQHETIYRPICWTEDGYERWLRCVSSGGAEDNNQRIRGGYRGP